MSNPFPTPDQMAANISEQWSQWHAMNTPAPRQQRVDQPTGPSAESVGRDVWNMLWVAVSIVAGLALVFAVETAAQRDNIGPHLRLDVKLMGQPQ